jgi:tellurite resistance protein TerC
MQVPLSMWAVFAGIVAVSLVVDLLSHRGEHGTGRKAAIAWSVAWIAVALGFCGWIALRLGRGPAEDFLTAYLMEKSLSVDNLFVFLLVFGQLKMKPAEQHRVLFWGILGALVFRGLFIWAGTSVLARWHEVVYALGAFLVFTGIRTLRSHGTEADEGRVMKFARERLRLKSTFLLAVVTIELTDIMFAIDSVPAVFAITDNPFIVYTSNVFAILGLRALYLVLSDLLGRLRYMHYGLSAILVFAGAKMLTSGFFHMPHVLSLAVIGGIMVVTVVASVVRRP